MRRNNQLKLVSLLTLQDSCKNAVVAVLSDFQVTSAAERRDCGAQWMCKWRQKKSYLGRVIATKDYRLHRQGLIIEIAIECLMQFSCRPDL